MKSTALLLFLLVSGALVAPAEAATIYKCRQAGGVVSYQDKPCPGRQIGVIRTAEVTAPARPAAPAADAPKADANAPAAQTARPLTTARAPRPSFKCTRPDGHVYFSGDARPQRTLADLTQAGAAWVPVAGAPAAPPGKMWVQDRCEPATRSESCQYYQQQIQSVDTRKQSASGTELRQLTREGQRLRAIHAHRCS